MKLLIGMVLLCATLACSQIVCNETIFECDSNNPNITTLIIGNKPYKLECNVGEVCNKKYNIETTCKPCIVPSTTCDDAFVCPEKDVPSRNILVNNFPLQCPEHKICNSKYLENCDLCIPVKCEDSALFECLPDNPNVYILNDMINNCRPGYVCNSDYFEPCKKCILPSLQRRLRLEHNV